jgi:NAD kinase
MRLTCQSTPSSNLLYTTNGRNGTLITEDFTNSQEPIIHAMNEVILHRGRSPHLTMLNISIDGVFLTEAIVPLFQSQLITRQMD